MLTFEECKQVLNENGNKYTDQQVQEICNLLYNLLEIDIENFKTFCNNERDNLQQGFDRRSGRQRA